jgi:flagellin
LTDVTLTAAARSALVDLQRTAQLSQRTRERLETGLRVNRPIDDGPAFFLAQNLIDRAGDLAQVKSGIGQAATAIGGTLAGIDAIGQVVGQLKGIAQAARGGSPEARAEAARQFDRLRSQIDAIAADTGFGGVRLLTEPAQSLTVNFNGAGPGGLTIQGRPSQAQSLGIGAAAGDFNNFATDADLDAALAGLGNATGALRASAAALGSNAGLLNTRFAFTEDLTQALRTGAGKLIDADLDEEAARLVTLRVRDGLGAAGLAIAAQSQRALLQLF